MYLTGYLKWLFSVVSLSRNKNAISTGGDVKRYSIFLPLSFYYLGNKHKHIQWLPWRAKGWYQCLPEVWAVYPCPRKNFLWAQSFFRRWDFQNRFFCLRKKGRKFISVFNSIVKGSQESINMRKTVNCLLYP